MSRLLVLIVIVQPFAPWKPVKITFPDVTEKIVVFCGAAISIPEWELEAPEVGLFLGPKGEVIVWKPGTGQKNSSFEK